MSTAPWVMRGHGDSRTWVPEGFEEVVDLETYRYMVVDELIEQMVTLADAPWPHLDDRGRLVFTDETRPVTVQVADLQVYLSDVRAAPPGADDLDEAAMEQFRSRALRLGDAFAAKEAMSPREATVSVQRGDETARVVDPARWLESPVYDITQQARQAAKLAFYAAAAPIMTSDEYRGEFAEVTSMGEDPYNLLEPPEEPGVTA